MELDEEFLEDSNGSRVSHAHSQRWRHTNSSQLPICDAPGGADALHMSSIVSVERNMLRTNIDNVIHFNCHYNHANLWLCSHGLESCSERRFGSRSKTWLGSWFELRAFTCIVNAFPITIRICALRGNILFLLRSPRWLTHTWLQHGFSAHFQNAHARITFRKSFAFTCPRIRLSTRITIQNALFSRFKTRFKSLIWNSFAFTLAKSLKSGFQIRKGPNDVLKRLSERDSKPCEHSLCLTWNKSVSVWRNNPYLDATYGSLPHKIVFTLPLLHSSLLHGVVCSSKTMLFRSIFDPAIWKRIHYYTNVSLFRRYGFLSCVSASERGFHFKAKVS